MKDMPSSSARTKEPLMPVGSGGGPHPAPRPPGPAPTPGSGPGAPNSLLAGFDLVLEISADTVFGLLANSVSVDGVFPLGKLPVLLPPLPLPASVGAETIQISLDDIRPLDFNPDDTISQSLPAHIASISVPGKGPVPSAIAASSDSLSVTVPVPRVIWNGGNQLTLEVDFSMATSSVSLAQTSESWLTGLGVTVPTLIDALESLLRDAVRQTPPIPILLPLPAAPLGTPEVHCIGTSQPFALGLFAILVVQTEADSHDHRAKTDTALTAGHDLCLSLSQAAFDQLFFCPSLARQAGVGGSQQLPPSCGLASSVPFSGAMLTSLSDAFGEGQLDIFGTATKSETGGSADIVFSYNYGVSVDGTTVQLQLLGQPSVQTTVHLDWWAQLLQGLVDFAVGPFMGPLNSAFNNYINGLATGLLTAGLEKNQPSGALPSGGEPLSFDQVTIAPLGLTLNGNVAPFLFVGSVSTVHSQEIYQGSSGGPSRGTPIGKHFTTTTVTESRQTQEAVYAVVTGLVPLQPPAFSIRVSGQKVVPLAAGSGTIELDLTTIHFIPPATGAEVSEIQKEEVVHIVYSVSGNTVTLTNVPAEGNFSLDLLASAASEDGQQTFSGSATVTFTGERVDTSTVVGTT